MDSFQGTPEAGQLLFNGSADHFCSMLAASCVFQVILAGALAAGAGLSAGGGVMKNIKEPFSMLSGLIQQGNVLRIPDVGRCTGSIHDHGAAVVAAPRMVVRLIVVAGFSFLFLTLLKG